MRYHNFIKLSRTMIKVFAPSAIGHADRESEQKAEEKFGEAEAKLQATEELAEALRSVNRPIE